MEARKISRVTMTSDASAVWEGVYPELSKSEPGLLGAILSRAEAQTLRLALIYALLDGMAEIGIGHLHAALALWGYCKASAQYIFSAVVGDPIEEVISAALVRAGEIGLTRTEIRDLFGRHRKRHEIDGALAKLEAERRATRVIGDMTGGRPPQVWIALHNRT